MKILIITLWIVTVSAGLGALWNYENQPGPVGERQQSFAPQMAAPDTYRLLLSLHPHCPCSLATGEELGSILASTGSSLRVQVLLFSPRGESTEWSRSALTELLKRYPHTSISIDEDGQQAARVGALTSGDVQLFDPAGKLIFHGGITAARGHSGDNAGKDAIIAHVLGQPVLSTHTPVFGCRIQDER
ncbi:MAG TPA: hypothetical protein VEJ63_13220 [Planctomycetota bacterium]|nr:hypothetical protein [Planctomycetota bacterium]